MTANAALIPGLDRIRNRFIDMLEDRLSELETLCDGTASEFSLRKSQNILHKIAGSAGTLGLQSLGDAARISETQIIEYLDVEGEGSLVDIYNALGDFAELAEDLLAEPA